MNAKHITQAIKALDKAASALRCGNLDIPSQIDLAGECNSAQFYLEHELEMLEIKIVKEK